MQLKMNTYEELTHNIDRFGKLHEAVSFINRA